MKLPMGPMGDFYKKKNPDIKEQNRAQFPSFLNENCKQLRVPSFD